MQFAHDRGKMRVLIIDDCRDSADTLYMLTKLWGHDSVAVYDGSTALDLCDVMRPDVMLVDIDMPGMDGVSLASALALLGDFPRPTMVAVRDSADRAAAAGFDHFLLKPIDPPALEHFLSDISASRRREPMARARTP